MTRQKFFVLFVLFVLCSLCSYDTGSHMTQQVEPSLVFVFDVYEGNKVLSMRIGNNFWRSLSICLNVFEEVIT